MTTADLAFRTTGIGSLPHHNIDAALEYSFQLDIPFLPQIPIRNPWEYMIPQALEGIPGLQVEADGATLLDLDVWTGRARSLDERLAAAFRETDSANRNAFETFEPSSATSSSWQPFLWECEERGVPVAKIQIAGPLTAQWSLRLKDGSRPATQSGLSTQIYRLILARSIAMCRKIDQAGIQPLIYIDEPGLYAFSAKEPSHWMALQELRLMIQTLRREGAWVGLHCCSNTDWKSVLGLELDVLSIDAGHSLAGLLHTPAPALTDFVSRGGRLSLGVVNTSRSSANPTGKASSLTPSALMQELFEALSPQSPIWARRIFSEALFTSACGLALDTPSEAQNVLALLQEFKLTGRATPVPGKSASLMKEE